LVEGFFDEDEDKDELGRKKQTEEEQQPTIRTKE
jgi:hypothetical protein